MANPLEQAIRSGIRANDNLVGALFADIGTSAHPRGFVVSAFRTARRALSSALRESYPLVGVDDVMAELKRSLSSGARSLLLDAQAAGREEAARQMRYYGLESQPYELGATEAIMAQIAALEAQVEAQHLAIRALLLTGAEPGQIVGDDERAGALRAGDVAATAAAMAAAIAWSSFGSYATNRAATGGLVFKKQAVAALDNRTTDCCLRVHGQVQPMGKPFRLTGTPRYADEMDWPAFHWWCRTSGVLYLDEFDAGLTARMREGAQTVLNERADGLWIDRHPADAFA